MRHPMLDLGYQLPQEPRDRASIPIQLNER